MTVRVYLLLILFQVNVYQVFAQRDSITVVKSKWEHKKLAKEVYWKTLQTQLFNSNQVINIIEISPKAKKIRLALAYSDSLEKTSLLAKKRDAIAGINGSFFKMRGTDPDYHSDLKGVPKMEPSYIGKNRSVVYLRVKDSLIANHVFEKDSLRRRDQQGVIALQNRQFSILAVDTGSLTWESRIMANDVMATGPVLLIGGKNLPIPNDDFCNDRHPRTAIGKEPDGTVILFVVDGRSQQAAGMTIIELQKTMRWLGCTDAINLDGGGSSTLYIKGQPNNGVVNYPSDNKQFDHFGEREVANSVLVIKP